MSAVPAPRVVSLIASATEIVAALGFEDRLVGRSHECDYPPGVRALPACSSSKVEIAAPSAEIDAQVRRLVTEAVSVYRVDPELLDTLAPTVIITQTQCEVCAVSLEDVERAVCELVRSSPRIVSLAPMGLDDIWRDIRTVAAALGAPARGDALVEALTDRLARLRCATAGTNRVTVACLEWTEPLMYAGNWVPELVETVGGSDLFGTAGRHSGYLRLPRLVEADPDVIAVMPCGFGLERTRRELASLAARPEWAELRAVREGRVFVTDGNQYFNRPGPRVVESAEILAELLHPDRVDFGHEGRGWVPFP